MRTSKPSIIWRDTKPDDPFDDAIMPDDFDLRTMRPPRGTSAGDDPHYIDRYEAEQLILSVEQFYDTAWPVDDKPLAA